jgi:uncharacterized membrane protein
VIAIMAMVTVTVMEYLTQVIIVQITRTTDALKKEIHPIQQQLLLPMSNSHLLLPLPLPFLQRLEPPPPRKIAITIIVETVMVIEYLTLVTDALITLTQDASKREILVQQQHSKSNLLLIELETRQDRVR